MKTFFIAVLALVLVYTKVFAEIKNAYENRIKETREELEIIKERIKEDKNRESIQSKKLAFHQKRKYNNKIDSLSQFILLYERTDRLLNRFHTIAPDIFHEMDTIKNAYGEETDVYVKFLPDEKMIVSQLGRTIMGQCFEDENICFSEYGIRSVLIIIYSETNPLLVLAHELGHVRYQVPHLASYFEYFKETYNGQFYEPYFIGHYPTDSSGISAKRVERRFVQYFNIYLKHLKSKVKDMEKSSDII